MRTDDNSAVDVFLHNNTDNELKLSIWPVIKVLKRAKDQRNFPFFDLPLEDLRKEKNLTRQGIKRVLQQLDDSAFICVRKIIAVTPPRGTVPRVIPDGGLIYATDYPEIYDDPLAQITLEHSFFKLFEVMETDFGNQTTRDLTSHTSADNLITTIPVSGKYKVHIRMARHFSKRPTVPNYILASCIDPTVLQSDGKKHRKLNKNDYEQKKSKYDSMIKNRLRILNRLVEQKNLIVKFNNQSSQLLPLF